MTDSPDNAPNGGMQYVSILDMLVVLAKHRKFIVRFTAISLAVSAIVVFLVLPRWYKSTAVVMPPKQKNTLGLLSSLSRVTAPLRSLGLGSTSEDLAQFETILASRRVMEEIVNRFDLRTVYDLETMEKAVKELRGNVEIGSGEEDVSIEIVVYDEDRQRAADMANYFVESLNRVYLDMSVTEARANRKFLEQRYQQNLTDLKNAEDNYKAFQQRYGVYSVPDQIKAAVDAAATLQSQITLKEIQLGLLEKTTTPDNIVRQTTEAELAELRHQMSKMMYGSKDDKTQGQIFAPFAKAPEIGIEYVRHYREVEIQGKILELLVPLYEQAKIEEQRDTPSVIVLDTAVPAIKAAKPKRLISMAVILILTILIACVVSFAREYLREAAGKRNETDDAKVALIKQEFRFKNLLR